MKMIYTITAYALILAFPICTAKALPPPTSDFEALYSKKVGKSPAEVIDYYEQHVPTSGADFFTLGLARYAKLDFERALDLIKWALLLQSDPMDQAVCFSVIAECHGALGQYDLAAEAALQGLRLKCGDKELEKQLAALRLGFATKAGDAVAVMAAEDHMMQLDPNFNRTPTIDPVTGAILIYAATKAIICLTKGAIAWIASHTQDPEAAKTIAEIGKSIKDPLEYADKLPGLLKSVFP